MAWLPEKFRLKIVPYGHKRNERVKMPLGRKGEGMKKHGKLVIGMDGRVENLKKLSLALSKKLKISAYIATMSRL